MSHGGADLELGGGRRRSSAGSECFSDADVESCYSQFYSTNGGSYDDDYSFAGESDAEIGDVSESRRPSDCSVVVVGSEVKEVRLGRLERNCRICHLGLESNGDECGSPIELGCSCKEDLAVAHKHCAETWFKIKGNKTCEICHSIARNVAGATEAETLELAVNESNNSTTVLASPPPPETQSFWQGRRFLNFLLACMVFAFVISWLFHFNVNSN